MLEEKIDIAPGKAYVKQVSLPAGLDEHDLRASLSVDGRELVAYSPVKLKPEPMPKSVRPPLEPRKSKQMKNYISPDCGSTSSITLRSSPILTGKKP